MLKHIYLDTNFWIEVERDFSSTSEISKLLSQLSENSHIVMSAITLIELSLNPKSNRNLLNLATFLDTIKIKWMRTEDLIVRKELEEYILNYDQLLYKCKNPFSDSIFDTFSSRFPAFYDTNLVTVSSNTSGIIHILLNNSKATELMSKFCHNSTYFISKIKNDREENKQLLRNTSILTNKFTKFINNEVASIASGIYDNDDAIDSKLDLFKSYSGLFLPANHFKPALKYADLKRFPYIWLSQEFMEKRVSQYPDYSIDKFLKIAQSEAFDFYHLPAAAYCDVFSCDKRTELAIRKTR